LLAAELVHALEHEWAVTLEDLLQRRSMVGLRADFGLGAATGAANALQRLGLWDSARVAEELAAYRALAARHRAVAEVSVP
jgi:glycerol-3-phosphate dehydrogenase